MSYALVTNLKFLFQFLQLGIPYLDIDLLLGYSENENLFGWRESVICELGQYIANTGRLFSRVADGNAPQ